MMVFSPFKRSKAAQLLTTVIVVLLGVVCFTPQPVDAIYPDDHWKYASALTLETFDGFIQDAIDADQTAFVRWIASPG